jgi:hypothetical protein
VSIDFQHALPVRDGLVDQVIRRRILRTRTHLSAHVVRVRHAGRGEHAVDPAELFDRAAHERVDVLLARDVGLHEQRAAIEADFDFAFGFGAAFGVEVGEHHVGAFFREASRGRPPQAACAAGDQRHAAFESQIRHSCSASSVIRWVAR